MPTVLKVSRPNHERMQELPIPRHEGQQQQLRDERALRELLPSVSVFSSATVFIKAHLTACERGRPQYTVTTDAGNQGQTGIQAPIPETCNTGTSTTSICRNSFSCTTVGTRNYCCPTTGAIKETFSLYINSPHTDYICSRQGAVAYSANNPIYEFQGVQSMLNSLIDLL